MESRKEVKENVESLKEVEENVESRKEAVEEPEPSGNLIELHSEEVIAEAKTEEVMLLLCDTSVHV